MKPSTVVWSIVGVTAVAFAALRTPLTAQTAGNPDVLPALLAEVRGLRVAMEQMVAAGPRVQVAMGRLTLQEQRVTAATRRVDDLHGQRIDAEREVAEMRQRASDMEAAGERSTDVGEKQALDTQVRMLRDAMARRAADVQRLTTEETDAAAALGNEQARWNELNQRIEELERSLARR